MFHGTGKIATNAIFSAHDYFTDFQYTYPHIKTPIFLLNARYDTWQLENILQLHCQAPNCTKEQMAQFENFGEVITHIL